MLVLKVSQIRSSLIDMETFRTLSKELEYGNRIVHLHHPSYINPTFQSLQEITWQFNKKNHCAKNVWTFLID